VRVYNKAAAECGHGSKKAVLDFTSAEAVSSFNVDALSNFGTEAVPSFNAAGTLSCFNAEAVRVPEVANALPAVFVNDVVCSTENDGNVNDFSENRAVPPAILPPTYDPRRVMTQRGPYGHGDLARKQLRKTGDSVTDQWYEELQRRTGENAVVEAIGNWHGEPPGKHLTLKRRPAGELEAFEEWSDASDFSADEEERVAAFL
jgi:hypothetical protein